MNDAPGFRVTLYADDGARVEFDAAPRQSLVKAAARAGYLITTGCLQGRCAICRATLLRGVVAPLRRASPNTGAVHASDDNAVVRLCSVVAGSDVELAPFSPWRVAAAP